MIVLFVVDVKIITQQQNGSSFSFIIINFHRDWK